RGGRRVVDGRRARGPRARGRGDQPTALPRAGADDRVRTVPRRRLLPPVKEPPMLKVAVPNKGSLSEAAAQMLAEAGYRQRRNAKDLVTVDADNDVEFFYLRPRDIAIYVGEGTLDVGITGRDLLID